MKTFMIFDMQTDEYIGEVLAFSVTDAEITASKKFDILSGELYAISIYEFQNTGRRTL